MNRPLRAAEPPPNEFVKVHNQACGHIFNVSNAIALAHMSIFFTRRLLAEGYM